MVAIHGGGWHNSDKSHFGRRTARAFTQDGYVGRRTQLRAVAAGKSDVAGEF